MMCSLREPQWPSSLGLCMLMCTSAHTCTLTHTCVHAHVYRHMPMCLCMCKHMQTHAQVSAHVCGHKHVLMHEANNSAVALFPLYRASSLLWTWKWLQAIIVLMPGSHSLMHMHVSMHMQACADTCVCMCGCAHMSIILLWPYFHSESKIIDIGASSNLSISCPHDGILPLQDDFPSPPSDDVSPITHHLANIERLYWYPIWGNLR